MISGEWRLMAATAAVAAASSCEAAAAAAATTATTTLPLARSYLVDSRARALVFQRCACARAIVDCK